MSVSAIVMMIIAMTVIWGDIIVSALNAIRHK